MRKEETTVYIAFDGKRFDNVDSCRSYEEYQKKILVAQFDRKFVDVTDRIQDKYQEFIVSTPYCGVWAFEPFADWENCIRAKLGGNDTFAFGFGYVSDNKVQYGKKYLAFEWDCGCEIVEPERLKAIMTEEIDSWNI